MAPPWHQVLFRWALSNNQYAQSFTSLRTEHYVYICLYQELRGFFRLFPGCECCQRRPSEQPWHDQSALWFSCGGKKLWTWLPLLVPPWHSAAQTLTFPSHCCSDFSCRGSKPEMAKGSVSCKNWLISTLPLEECLTEMATQCNECATHALMSELATKSCLNVSNPIWSSSVWISCQEAKMRCAWAALGNLSSVTCTQTWF